MIAGFAVIRSSYRLIFDFSDFRIDTEVNTVKKSTRITRVVSFVLALVLTACALLLTACKDPLQAKIDAMDKAFAAMGEMYVRARAAVEYAGVYDDYSKQFDQWKNYISNAKGQNADYLSYSGAELDGFVEEWKATTAEIRTIYEQFTYDTDEDGQFLH